MSLTRTIRQAEPDHPEGTGSSAGDPRSKPRKPRSGRAYVGAAVGLLALGVVAAGFFSRGWWLPKAERWIGAGQGEASAADHVDVPGASHAGHEHDGIDDAGHDHGDHAVDDHDHGDSAGAEHEHEHADASRAEREIPGSEGVDFLELSEQARKNIGLTLATVAEQEFQRTVSVPATVVNRPGRTEMAVSAPMTGIVARIYPIRGEAVTPGDPLFELRLTHEDLVEKQSALVRALEELDVVEREVARLEQVTASGAVAGKRLLQRQYEREKIEAAIRAERQALRLHGLSDEQIATIVEDRRLLESLTIPAPAVRDHPSCAGHEFFLQVTQLAVKPGEHVTAGTLLGVLTDHCELHIEGKAFEQDAEALNRAASQGVPVAALIEANDSGRREVPGLKILYVENEVEIDSRALKFYVGLPNEVVRNQTIADGRRFIGWRYRPGQRVELLVPVERWEHEFVLPVEAVVREGAECFVYERIGRRFHRRPVHVAYRDRQRVVIEADGSLHSGDVVAAQGAYQIHLALKNKSGGGPDPHAGHQH